jgi:hypothetical protein
MALIGVTRDFLVVLLATSCFQRENAAAWQPMRAAASANVVHDDDHPEVVMNGTNLSVQWKKAADTDLDEAVVTILAFGGEFLLELRPSGRPADLEICTATECGEERAKKLVVMEGEATGRTPSTDQAGVDKGGGGEVQGKAFVIFDKGKCLFRLISAVWWKCGTEAAVVHLSVWSRL